MSWARTRFFLGRRWTRCRRSKPGSTCSWDARGLRRRLTRFCPFRSRIRTLCTRCRERRKKRRDSCEHFCAETMSELTSVGRQFRSRTARTSCRTRQQRRVGLNNAGRCSGQQLQVLVPDVDPKDMVPLSLYDRQGGSAKVLFLLSWLHRSPVVWKMVLHTLWVGETVKKVIVFSPGSASILLEVFRL